ncbi:MAG: hypothetical protein ABL989_06920 [Gammaproteobacteria bacterium]
MAGTGSRQALHQSVLAYRGSRYLWVALALCLGAIVAYAWHSPGVPPNGGTWLGYTLGTVGAVLILWLMSFGIRKRSYASRAGTVQGWLSAHVYLGLALLVVVTLHAGFQLGWNVHTLAYVLTCIVVASGVFGVFVYVRYPQFLSDNRGSQTKAQLLADLADLDSRSLRVAAGMPPEFAEALRANRDRTLIGGTALALLAARDRSQIMLPLAVNTAGAVAFRQVANPDQAALLDYLGQRLAASGDGGLSRQLQELLSLAGARRTVLARLRRDAQLKAWLEIWLYVHVPLSFGLLAALLAHVLAVFIYW